jgi:hypothetical protein
MAEERLLFMRFNLARIGFMTSLILQQTGLGQAPSQVVQWSAAVTPKGAAKQGRKVDLELSASVQEGWHVYALTQISGGPTPLHVSLDENTVVQMAGVASGSAPVRKHDPSFDLDTELYSRTFTLRVPIEVKRHAALGNQTVPVSVRFQSCNDRTCLPPRTVHLTVPIEIQQRR